MREGELPEKRHAEEGEYGIAFSLQERLFRFRNHICNAKSIFHNHVQAADITQLVCQSAAR